jgi:putative two-component system response regulator
MPEKIFTALIVDDEPINIKILMEALQGECAIVTATNGEKALKIANSDVIPDIILLDIMMPVMDGFEVIENLKKNDNTKNIPVMFLTSMSQNEDEEKGLELGAVDYILKPFNSILVKKRVHNQLELKMYRDKLLEEVYQRTSEINETRLEIIRKLGRAAEYKDNETGKHVIRMSKYSQFISQVYGLSVSESELILNASPMHDLGKIGIPDKIMLKPGKLDDNEWNIMRRHPYIGYKIIGEHKSVLINSAGIIAYSHHEKWNGSGYPRRLKGNDIPLYARIIAIADVFDALTTRRPYKEPWPVEKAVDLIKDEKGKHFDPVLVDSFLETMDDTVKVMKLYAD